MQSITNNYAPGVKMPKGFEPASFSLLKASQYEALAVWLEFRPAADSASRTRSLRKFS